LIFISEYKCSCNFYKYKSGTDVLSPISHLSLKFHL